MSSSSALVVLGTVTVINKSHYADWVLQDLCEFCHRVMGLTQPVVIAVGVPTAQGNGEAHWFHEFYGKHSITIAPAAKNSYMNAARFVLCLLYELYHIKEQHLDPTAKTLDWSEWTRTGKENIPHETRPEELRASYWSEREFLNSHHADQFDRFIQELTYWWV